MTLAEARDKALENRRTAEFGGDPRTFRSALPFAEAAGKLIVIRAGGWKPDDPPRWALICCGPPAVSGTGIV